MPDDTESSKPDYVNKLAEGRLKDTPRCEHGFAHHWDPDVTGNLCGLPAENHEADPEPRCYFHSRRSRENDNDLKVRMTQAVVEGCILWEARLTDAKLQGAMLWLGNLQGAALIRADLQGANLWGANLRAAHLHEANLHGAVLLDANLQGAGLSAAKLHGARLEGANLRDADLGLASFGILQVIDVERNTAVIQPANLRGTHLEGALVSRTTFASESDLSGAFFGDQVYRPWWQFWQRAWSKYHIEDERCARSDFEWEKIRKRNSYLGQFHRPTLADCESVYRQLKLSYQQSGDYQKTGEFYVREMECNRNQRPRYQRGVMSLMYYLCGYGERPDWVLGWAGLALLFFAFLHGGVGVCDTQGVHSPGQPPSYVIGPGIGWPSWAGFGRWLTAFYFSVVTFTTLGYGDLRAAPLWGRAAAGTEALLGFVLLSLFLVCIVRKFSR